MHPFTKRLLLLIACGVAGSCTIFGLTSIAKYKPYGVPDLLREEWEARQTAIQSINSPDRLRGNDALAAEHNSTPAGVVEESEFDFGMLDAGTSAKHAFVIRNDGDAPLVITAGETSCKCTLSEASAEVIAPGSAAEVTLTWNTGSSRKFYRQYAIIRTNDPKNREIELAVLGQIRTQLGFSTKQLVAPGVSPGSGAKAETIVFSQTLDLFEVTEAQCGLPGFQYHVEPASDDLLRSLGARSAWRLCVSTDGSLEAGSFVDVVRIGIQSEQLGESDSTLVREIMFHGKVLPPVTFYSPNLHRENGLELGITSAGDALVSHVIVRVRGEQLPSTLEVSEVHPEILHTKITPLDSRPGVFRLTITVPADAPQTIFNTEQEYGFIEVRDPENPTIRNRFPVRGAVLAF